MRLYRIGKSKYARDLSGEGAMLYGGRWNHKGIPCIYTAESRALCLLEYSVHVQSTELPKDLSFTILDLPDQFTLSVSTMRLPANWQDWPHPQESKDFGSQLIMDNKYLTYRLPSSVLPAEFNHVINPSHIQMKKVRIVAVEKYSFDTRIKK